MATYAELRQAVENPELNNKVRVACVMAANAVALEADTVPLHSQRIKWAAAVFENPDREGQRMVWSVLAKNASATLAQILAATDAQVQTAVDDSVNVFAQVQT